MLFKGKYKDLKNMFFSIADYFIIWIVFTLFILFHCSIGNSEPTNAYLNPSIHIIYAHKVNFYLKSMLLITIAILLNAILY